MRLTDEIVENVKPSPKMVRMSDARGMYLEVSPTGRKWWRLKYRFSGRENRMSLGVYPEVTLEDARARCEANRALLASGVDPVEHNRALRAKKLAERARAEAENRFTLDRDGALFLRLGQRYLNLTPTETDDLRGFLDATRTATLEAPPCP